MYETQVLLIIPWFISAIFEFHTFLSAFMVHLIRRGRRIAVKAKRLIFPLRIDNNSVYRSLFAGMKGIEIGGPSKCFEKKGFIPLYDILGSLDGCNFGSETIWEGKLNVGKSFRYGKRVGEQYISEASDLTFVPDEKYDIVLSSHCLEHLANPIKALKEWKRILTKTGYLILILPDKSRTFDRNRPVTALQHMIDDYESDKDERDQTHFDEVLALHDFSLHPDSCIGEEFKNRTWQNYQNRCVHHHVFDLNNIRDLLKYMEFKIMDLQFVHPFNIVAIVQKNHN